MTNFGKGPFHGHQHRVGVAKARYRKFVNKIENRQKLPVFKKTELPNFLVGYLSKNCG